MRFPVVLILLILSPMLLNLSACKKRGHAASMLHVYKNSRKLGLHKLPFSRKARVDETFRPWIASFESFYGGSIGEVGVGFGKTRKGTFGSCRISWNGVKRVSINRSKWDHYAALPFARENLEVLLFHELGHCVLERLGHENGRIMIPWTDAVGHEQLYDAPASLMAESINGKDLLFIRAYREQYIRELFTGIPVVPDPQPVVLF